MDRGDFFGVAANLSVGEFGLDAAGRDGGRLLVSGVRDWAGGLAVRCFRTGLDLQCDVSHMGWRELHGADADGGRGGIMELGLLGRGGAGVFSNPEIGDV